MTGPQENIAPSWLNQTFLENALKKSFKNDDLKIVDLKMELATAAALNFASLLFRANLTLKGNLGGIKEKKASVIIKIVNTGETGKELDSLQIYDKEADAFTNVLPAIDLILKRAFPECKKLWADCYYHQKLPNYVLILEDLCVKGFTPASRFEGLDMEHAILVLKSLAKFHAASLIWIRENPEKCEGYRSTCWNNRNGDMVKKVLNFPFKILAEDVLNWTEFDEREIFSEKLKCIMDNVLERNYKLWEVDSSKLNVLLHGDAWLNNFMFKYDPNGKLTGFNFVDFQLMNINNPAMDLQYFIATSLSPNLRFDHVDLFLQTYYEAFDDTLKRLGHRLEKPYSLEQLQKDFEEKYFWGFIMFCVVYPVLAIPSSEAFHPDELLSNEINNSYIRIYTRRSLREVLMRGFKYYEEKGVL